MIRFACPACHKVLQAPPEKAGVKVACPGCKGPITIPQAENSAQAVSASPQAPPPAPLPKPPAAGEGGWLYIRDGQRQGPVSWQELQQLAATGKLSPSDQVWSKGMARAVPAQQVQGLIVPRAESAEPTVPAWQRALGETKEIARATGVQTIRPLRFGSNVIRGRTIQRRAGDSQLALGQKLYELQQGDAALRGRIHDLGERAHNINASKAEINKLVAERKQALQELAEPALMSETPPPGAELEHAAARESRSLLDTYRDQMKADRLMLLPADKAAWRRVGIGYGVAAVAALFAFFVLLPGKPESEKKEVASNTKEKSDSPKRVLKPMTTEEIHASYAPAVCLIKSEKNFGTGFLIRPGVIATNAHVLGLVPVKQFRVSFPSSKDPEQSQAEPKLLYYDAQRDLAFLKIDSKLTPLAVADSYEFRPGRDICIIGNPGLGPRDNLNNSIAKGLVSSEKTLRNLKFFQLDLTVNPGNSGGPVFDSHGQVIGVITLKASAEERISFCIPLNDLKTALAKYDKQGADDAARAAARYHFDMAFVRVAGIGQLYAVTLTETVSRVIDDFRRKQDPAATLQRGREILNSLRRAETRILRDVHPIDDIASDRHLPADLKQKFADLRKNIDEMKNQADNLRGDVRALETRIRTLRDKHQELVENIRVAVGMDKDDLIGLDDDDE